MEYPDVTVERKYDGKPQNVADAVSASMKRMAEGWVENQEPVKSVLVRVVPMNAHSNVGEDRDVLTDATMRDALGRSTAKLELVMLGETMYTKGSDAYWYRQSGEAALAEGPGVR